MNYLAGAISAVFVAVALITMRTSGLAVQLAAGFCPLLAMVLILSVRVLQKPLRPEAYLSLDFTVALPALAMMVKYMAFGGRQITFAEVPAWHSYAWLAFSLAFTTGYLAIDLPERRTAGAFVLMMLAGFLCFHGMYLVSDVAFDHSRFSIQRFVVTDKTLVSSVKYRAIGGATYLLVVKPPLYGSSTMNVNRVTWESSAIGGTLCLYTHKGALNRSWGQIVSCG